MSSSSSHLVKDMVGQEQCSAPIQVWKPLQSDATINGTQVVPRQLQVDLALTALHPAACSYENLQPAT